jgi:hypothetical protein
VGKAGEWIEKMYKLSEENNGVLPPNTFPINTHGGLLAFGAPWETPAMYNIIEAVQQLNGTATNRQVDNARRALVYGNIYCSSNNLCALRISDYNLLNVLTGNGGIFSASAVAILGKGQY